MHLGMAAKPFGVMAPVTETLVQIQTASTAPRPTEKPGGDVDAPPEAIAEARKERFWRDRCGEPNLDRFPLRCRRDLNHPTPHVALFGELVAWEGEGNAFSAQVGGNGHYKCWRDHTQDRPGPTPPRGRL